MTDPESYSREEYKRALELQALKNQVNALKTEVEALKAMATAVQSITRLQEIVAEMARTGSTFNIQDIPSRQRALLPYVLDWYDERGERGKDWKYYLPLIVSFVGPILAGIIVAFTTLHLGIHR